MPTRFRALVLAAGVGSRLRPLSNVLPKCLMPINGKPLLGYWLRMLCEAGVDEIIVNLHHHADLVEHFISRSPYASIVSAVRETRLLGTGGTLLRHRKRLEGGPVLFVHGDNLSLFDPQRFLGAHLERPSEADLTMMTFETDSPRTCGIVECDDRGLVTRFHEKVDHPPGTLANAAVYLVESSVFDFLESTGKEVIDFSIDVVPHFLGRISTFHNDIYHRDIGNLDSLLRAQFEYPLAAARSPEGRGQEDPWFGLFEGRGADIASSFLQNLERAITTSHHSE